MDDVASDSDDPSPPHPLMGHTENMSATFTSSGNPCLDFFFHIVPHTTWPKKLTELIKPSWDHDPLKTTLKLICNLRGVRGTEKSDKENFYVAALWLHENHPKTLACNLRVFAQFGCFKDLPEILYWLLEGLDIWENKKDAWMSYKKMKVRRFRRFYFEEKKKNSDKNLKEAEEKRLLRARVLREKRVEANAIKVNEQMAKTRKLRREKALEMAKRASERYEKDENYRYLHDQVSAHFAERLTSNIQALKSAEPKRISLAAKWYPSLDSSYDKATLLCKSIAKIMFPSESLSEYRTLSKDNYVFSVRNRLRKEIIVPLNQSLNLPEVYMSAQEWGLILYDRVASIVMTNYTDIFLHRDNKRFRDYLENVKAGTAKITSGALLLHEVIAKSLKGSSGAGIVSELQWKRMMDDLKKKGRLSNCLAICDVSRSMSGTPLDVVVALGLVVSELSEEQWRGHVITFSAEPKLHLIKLGNLRSKVSSLRNMDWGTNTDFQKVFDKILQVAVDGKLSGDKMIKRLFVFSHMEFDQASANQWETDYMAIKRKFKEKGFENVPEIVFWNLQCSYATPVLGTQNGVAMVSGFSKNLLRVFMEGGGVVKPEEVGNLGGVEEGEAQEEMNPEDTMEKAISVSPPGRIQQRASRLTDESVESFANASMSERAW